MAKDKTSFGLVGPLAALLLTLFLVSAAESQEVEKAIRDELLTMEKVDQDARIGCTSLTANEQAKCLAEISRTIDTPNTKRLREIFDEIGFPNMAKVGKDGFQAFMILLQHATSDDLRARSLKPIRAAFKNKELPALNYANFVDRLRLHQGKKQLYGSGFDFKDGKLVMSPTKDIKNLEKRRSKIGLPPLAEYIKDLEEMYHLKAEVPK